MDYSRIRRFANSEERFIFLGALSLLESPEESEVYLLVLDSESNTVYRSRITQVLTVRSSE